MAPHCYFIAVISHGTGFSVPAKPMRMDGGTHNGKAYLSADLLNNTLGFAIGGAFAVTFLNALAIAGPKYI